MTKLHVVAQMRLGRGKGLNGTQVAVRKGTRGRGQNRRVKKSEFGPLVELLIGIKVSVWSVG